MESELGEKSILVEYLPPCKERKLVTPDDIKTYSVTLKNIDGLKETASDSYYLQAILFDKKYRRFIGSTWSGLPVKPRHTQIVYNLSFYFYTSVPASELLVIIEIISESNITHGFKICGWIYLPLIEVEEDAVYYKKPFISGSPLFLLSINDEGEADAKLAECTTGMEISLSLAFYPKLLQISHLFPENVLIDANMKIPGVLSETEEIDGDYVFNPQLQNCITVVLERFCIRMKSHRNIVEKEILQKVQAHLIAAKPDENLINVHLVQRRLQVAVHNGFCFIQEPDFYHLHAESLKTLTLNKALRRASSLGSLNTGNEEGLVLRSDIKLPNVPEDPNISIVFLLEYIIALENTEDKNLSLASVNKNPICNIAVGWGSCQLDSLKSNPSQTITLSCDPALSPHKIKFLKTKQILEMTFSAFSLLKQNRNVPHLNSLDGCISDTSPSNISNDSPMAPSKMQSSFNHATKHKSVADIPMSVEQYNSQNSGRGNSAYGNENNLVLQEVTLVSSSLPLIPPLLHSFAVGTGESFETFTKTYSDKINPVLDHQGKPAHLIDNSMPYRIDLDIELMSPPQINECILHFLAISCLDEYVEIPCEVFLTFQFYRFLPVKTESLVLKQLSENIDSALSKSSFVFALHKKKENDKIPGFQVTYKVDPTDLNQGEYKSFINYLMKQTIHVDLWNAHSLLYFGTIAVPLKYFCRQGKQAVLASLELDIINCEFPDESLCQNSVSSQKPLGKLHVSLACISHPLSTKSLEKFEDGDVIMNSPIIISKGGKCAANSSSGVTSKARPIVEIDRELSKLLCLRNSGNNSRDMQPDPNITEERRHKLARMEAVRNLENNKSTNHRNGNGMHHFFKEKQQDLLSIESYIKKNKTEIIHSLLHKSVTSEKVIYPVIGSKEYFEFVIENPFPTAKKIEIIWKCPDLNLVVSNKVWQLLRSVHSLSQKIHPLNFIDVDQQTPSILLEAGEKAHIPFVYQSFSFSASQLDSFKAVSGHRFTTDVLSSMSSVNLSFSSAKIRFMTEEQTLLAVLKIKIQLLPPSFTHVFKFLSMENSMFKKCIQIKRENMNEVTLQCSDPTVVCSVQETQVNDENLKILVKAPTKSSGKCSEFNVFVFNDDLHITPFQTWYVCVYPLQRIDLSCVAGQLMRSSLLIRGTQATNLVRCFSSCQDLQLDPSEPFILSPFAVQELSMNVRSLIPGIRHFQISMVNQSAEQVLQSWLLVLSCQKPSVSKAFQIHLSIGKEAAKRITYTNPYHQSRSFCLHSSHPHLLNLREERFTVSPGESYYIGLYFLPQEYVFSETIFLYMNDASDKNEETYCIKVMCQ